MRTVRHNGPWTCKASALHNGAVFLYDADGLVKRPMLVLKMKHAYVALDTDDGESHWPREGVYQNMGRMMDNTDVRPVDAEIHVRERQCL